MNLQIEKENAIKAFNTTNADGKELLSNLFGKEVFNLKITDRVKTAEDAYKVLGLVQPPLFCTPISKKGDELSVEAYRTLIVVAKALNEGWQPDWDDTSEYKYFPYFKQKAGFGLSYDDCAYWFTRTDVGSRLCFKSSAIAKYAGEQFKELYEAYYLI